MEKQKRHAKSYAREHAMIEVFKIAYNVQNLEMNSFDEMANEMAKNIQLNIEDIDNEIKKYLRKWMISEINPVVLSILRVSIYEIKYENTPESIVINEAIDLAKKYADDEGKKFVHGVLNNYVRAKNA